MATTAPAGQPSTLQLSGLGDGGPVGVRLRRVDPATVAAVDDWRAAFRVVVRPDPPAGDDLPAVAGRYSVAADGVRFVPHFPFVPGVRYRAVFDPRAVGDGDGSTAGTLDFTIPAPEPPAAAEVARVYPSADRLPENLLRFYVCFSAPMQRGRAGDHVAVLGPNGRPAADVLYRPPVELWDRGMTCLTVLLDPGRLKRGVGPNRDLGPPLAAGRAYALQVGTGMLDAAGRPLDRPFRKWFSATPPVREAVAVDRWAVDPPPAGTRRPMSLTFPRPLDRAMLSQAIALSSATGGEVDGQAVVDDDETRWRFTPSAPWRSGTYRLAVRPWLEDVCGNTTTAAFDRALGQSDAPPAPSADRWIRVTL